MSADVVDEIDSAGPLGETEKKPMGRVIAIVGRPNVGKSAIFNRLAGGRIAIVHAMAGVTRDRLVRDVVWENDRFRLIDTGGITAADGEKVRDVMDAEICSQARAALDDAPVAILVVDITAGLTPMDVEVARILRRKGTSVFVAANKADEVHLEKNLPEFDRLGFPVFPVSALHGRGFADLMDAVLPRLPKYNADVDGSIGLSSEEPLRVAIVGRPNAGKSSLINKLLGNPRVIVSDVPGTTRDSIDIPFSVGEGAEARHYTLIDTAGARRDSKIDGAVERYSRYRAEASVDRADIIALVLDCSRPIGKLEKQLAGEAVEKGKGCLIIVNKWDVSETNERGFMDILRRDLPFMAFCPVIFTSAVTGFRVKRCVDMIDHVAEQTQMTLPTGTLNKVMTEAADAIPAPTKNGRPFRIYYATQVGRSPVTVRIFANDPTRMPASYRDYLINRLRDSFGLEGAPVYLQIRRRERPSDNTGTYRSVKPARRPKDASGKPRSKSSKPRPSFKKH